MKTLMNDDIYLKLRDHLDSMPAGYPTTPSGAELKMLQKFYTPRQARIAVHIGQMPENAQAISDRLDMDTETAIKDVDPGTVMPGRSIQMAKNK